MPTTLFASVIHTEVFTRGGGIGEGFLFVAALDQFFSRAGRCFPDLLLRAFEALFIIGVHAAARPVVAVEVFRGSALATSRTLRVPLAEF